MLVKVKENGQILVLLSDDVCFKTVFQKHLSCNLVYLLLGILKKWTDV